mmetsp:Transcript_40810/g.94594  ORF Transcript_40810/g.94594 Transcript_40810/m.94594 type:complete len:261 (+) Transcript_40810:285-1067(+)
MPKVLVNSSPASCSSVCPGNEWAPCTWLTSKSRTSRASRKIVRSRCSNRWAASGEIHSCSASKKPMREYCRSRSRKDSSISSTVAWSHQGAVSLTAPKPLPKPCLARRRAALCSRGSESVCMAPKSFLKAACAAGCGFLSGCTSSEICRYCLRIFERSSSSCRGNSSVANSLGALVTHSTAASGERGSAGSWGRPSWSTSRFPALRSLVPSRNLTCQRSLALSCATSVPCKPFSSAFACRPTRRTRRPGCNSAGSCVVSL